MHVVSVTHLIVWLGCGRLTLPNFFQTVGKKMSAILYINNTKLLFHLEGLHFHALYMYMCLRFMDYLKPMTYLGNR